MGNRGIRGITALRLVAYSGLFYMGHLTLYPGVSRCCIGSLRHLGDPVTYIEH